MYQKTFSKEYYDITQQLCYVMTEPCNAKAEVEEVKQSENEAWIEDNNEKEVERDGTEKDKEAQHSWQDPGPGASSIKLNLQYKP